MVEISFAVFGIAALLLFRLVAPAEGVAYTCIAGWLLLPVGHFPEGSEAVMFPYWITGLAVPSDMLLTKMWWPPVVALCGALITDHRTIACWRPRWIDVPMALWCLWPVLQWFLFADHVAAPRSWVSFLYITAAWGVPWLLGRIYFSGVGGRRFATALVAGLVVIAPIAMIEGLWGSKVYGWLYETHPFRNDGIARYIGFRPLGFFENGNQYGIWVAATALAAIWLWQSTPDPRRRRALALVAAAALAIALVSQSVGAILCLFVGLALLWGFGRSLTRWVMLAGVLVILAGGAIYLSGVIPFRALAEQTAIGKKVVSVAGSLKIRSGLWRVARDQKALTLVREHPIIGAARWDWWRSNDERPWGLALLIVGQFGLVGMALAFGSLLIPAFRVFMFRANPRASPAEPTALFAATVAMTVGDALLNSFLFYPAVLMAGALGSAVMQGKGKRNLPDDWRSGMQLA